MSTQTTPPVTPATLRRLFELSYNVAKQNVEGFDHTESIRQPKEAGNCLNWVMGHIVATRNRMFVLIGIDPVWDETRIQRYDRGSAPITEDADAVRFEEILADFDRTQALLREALAGMGPDELSAPVPEERNALGLDNLGETLAAFSFHESYHSGQTGVLRRVLGRDGAIN